MCVCVACTVAHRRGVCRITPQNYKLSRIMVYATRYFFDTSLGLCAFLGFLNFCGWEVHCYFRNIAAVRKCQVESFKTFHFALLSPCTNFSEIRLHLSHAKQKTSFLLCMAFGLH